ncbi:MAG: ATPase, T2SS/T4P/T4SS family [Phycisphaerae bacterium]|nr:ATPase, T2SS/T4P/T4SS family [Phycisphaerae bacterium]
MIELWVYNQYTDMRQAYPLTADRLTIGREAENDIALPSPFVSREHARLVKEDGGFYIESLGLNGTMVGTINVPANQRLKVQIGDEIHIGEYTIYLVEKEEKSTVKRERMVPVPRRVVELEQTIHSELLDRLNLRVATQVSKEDSEYIHLIKRHLNELISSHSARIDKEMMEHLGRELIWRQVVGEVTRRSTGKDIYGTSIEAAGQMEIKYEEAVRTIVRDIINSLPLKWSRDALKDDLNLVERKFPDQFKRISGWISAGLREYLSRRMLSKDVEDVVLGLGPLQDLLELPNVNEIMVVGKDKIYVEKDGAVTHVGRAFFSDEIVHSIIERIITPIGRRIDRSTPLVDARLPDGSRVNAIIDPLSLSGPCLTIRKFAEIPFTIDDLIERGSLTRNTANFLSACVKGRKNILISGGTASGKTTLLNVMAAFIHGEERIITIEDSAELQLPQEHWVRLETRPANIEGKGAYTIRDLVRNALRMRPDRLVVGECRGAEALDMLQAMNTGHNGSMTTLHANNPTDTLMRLETMVMMAVEMPIRAIREQILSAIDVVVQVARFADGRRRVTHITEVTDMDRDTNQLVNEDIFALRGAVADAASPDVDLRHTGYIPTFTEELMDKGFLDISVFTRQ